MNKIYIKSSISIIELIDLNDVKDNIISDDFFTSYIPSVELLETSFYKDATITIEKCNKNKLELNYPSIYYGYVSLNTKDVISLIEYILERSRQEQGIVCIHGAGAIVNNKLVVCTGTTTGMGKTTLALSLANNNMFYSDEKILIDLKNKKCVGRIKNQYISNDYWKNKYGDVKYYEHQSISDNIEYEIGLFVEPIICEQKKYIIDYWEPKKFLWHLYEESSRKIRGTSRIFFDNSYPAMSLDTPTLALKRLELLKIFTKEIEAIYYKGRIKYIVKIIEEKIQN